MSNNLLSWLALMAVFCTGSLTHGQNDDANQFTEGPGIEVGETLPAIKLNNQDDQELAISELLKSDNVALVFYRSADW